MVAYSTISLNGMAQKIGTNPQQIRNKASETKKENRRRRQAQKFWK